MPHLFWKPTAKGYMPSYFDTGNAILINLKTAIHPWPDSFFRVNIPKMNSHFSRSIHWFVCLLCISLNALADAPSPSLNALADAPPLTLKNSSMPAFAEAGRIQGHYERGIEAIGEAELRGVPPLAVADRASPVPATRSRPAVSAAKKIVNPNKFVFTEVGRTQGHQERGVGTLYEDELRGVPPLAVADGASPVPATRSRPAVSAAKKIVNPNKFVFTEVGRTQGHQERGVGTLYEDELRGVDSESRLVYIDAERMEGTVDKMIEAIGDVELRSDDKLIVAKQIKYFQDTEEVVAEGGVRIEHQGRGDIIEGSQLKLKLENTTGQLSQVNYRLQKGLQKDGGNGRGSANLLLFEGEHNYRAQQGSYTTCPAGDDDWMLLADDLAIDNKQKEGIGRHVRIEFKGVPILYTPWVSFSIDNKTRKSGLLAPEAGYNARTGAELTVPFYWNIAPNIDATFSARMMSNRGIMLQNELRYLAKNAKGDLLLEVLPSATSGAIPGATASDLNRYNVAFKHEQSFGYGWTGNVDFNKVSDNNYFIDLAYDVTKTSLSNLKQEASLAYQRNLWGDGSVDFKAVAQSFQNIRGSGVYQRLPEFTLNITKPNMFGTALDLKSSWASFSHRDPTKATGSRLVLNPSVSVPLRKEFGHIIPKIGLHQTSYDLNPNSQGTQQLDRTLPIFSLDSGVVLERGVALRGERLTQTLEPRAMYVYIPYRDQSQLPNFDSTFTDFSFAQIFSENRFSGSDRINDANRLSLGLTSRLLEPNLGTERLSFSVGQVLHFVPTRVTALGTPQANSKIDFFTGVTGHFTPQIKTDTTLQLDQSKMEVDVVRSALSYNPQLGRIINLGYRYSRFGPGLNLSANPPLYPLNPLGLHQADISTQWRFSEKWQAVGKINYSILDSRILESLTGIEYNACCWSLRFMFSHMAITPTLTTTAAFLQLELNGLMGIGISPLKALQQRIPGYTDTSPTARNPGGGP
jgi:LPS-assembly protein